MTYESVFDNGSVRVKLADTEDGIALSLDFMDEGESTAGTTIYIGPEQINGMCSWLDKYRTVRLEERRITSKRELLERVTKELNLDLRDPFTLIFANACALSDACAELRQELEAVRSPRVPLVDGDLAEQRAIHDASAAAWPFPRGPRP